MYAVMTVTGVDHIGIIGAVTGRLAELEINILDVSQTIMDKWFTMVLRVELPTSVAEIPKVQEAMVDVEKHQHVAIRIQSEALFSAVNEV